MPAPSPTRASRFASWLQVPANLTFALGVAGVIFTVVFWAVTTRFEPTFVATFGGMLTASGLLASKQAASTPVEAPAASPPIRSEEGGGA